MDTPDYLNQLHQDGILILEDFIHETQLLQMQQAFNHKLTQLNFNSTNGYQRYEMYRDYVEDLMTVDPAFVNFAVHPELVKIIKGYISNEVILNECRGWRTRVVKEETFQAWHKDGWYDKKIYSETPKQIKVAIYLSDVTTGSFAYIKGSHRSIKSDSHTLHEHFTDEFAEPYKKDIVYALGKAGTVIVFDTSGVHRQTTPNLTPRNIAFYNYHEPHAQIDPSELEYGRYGRLLVNNAYIDESFTVDDLKVLGFFQKKSDYKPTKFLTRSPILAALVKAEVEAAIYLNQYVFNNVHRVINRLTRVKKP